MRALIGGGLGFFLQPGRESFRVFAQPRQFFFALLQPGFALLPALFEGLLLLLVLLFRDTQLFFVFVLGFLALQSLFVFVVVDVALPLLFQAILLFLALALGAFRFFLPGGALRGDLGFELLLLVGIVLHHLVQSRGRHIDLVQPLEFFPFEGHGLADRRQQLHLFDELGGEVRQRPGDFQAQRRNPLHHAFHRGAFGRLPDFVLAQASGLLAFDIRRLARLFHFFLDVFELLLHFRPGALGAHGSLRRFHWHL